MSFKEIVSLAVGGLGIQFVVFCAQNMIISIGNTLISNTIGIAPKPLYIIYILSVILSFPLTALRGKIIDSSKSKKGRYRPFILSMGLPTAILAGIKSLLAVQKKAANILRLPIVPARKQTYEALEDFVCKFQG